MSCNKRLLFIFSDNNLDGELDLKRSPYSRSFCYCSSLFLLRFNNLLALYHNQYLTVYRKDGLNPYWASLAHKCQLLSFSTKLNVFWSTYLPNPFPPRDMIQKTTNQQKQFWVITNNYLLLVFGSFDAAQDITFLLISHIGLDKPLGSVTCFA